MKSNDFAGFLVSTQEPQRARVARGFCRPLRRAQITRGTQFPRRKSGISRRFSLFLKAEVQRFASQNPWAYRNRKNHLFPVPQNVARHPRFTCLTSKHPKNIRPFESDMPTTFFLEPGLTFFRGENDLDERREFMLSAEKQPHPSAPVRQAPGRKSAVEQKGRAEG